MHDPRNAIPPGAWPSPDEIDKHIGRARTLRAEATAAFLGSAGHAVVRLTRRLVSRLGRVRVPDQARSKPEQVAHSTGPRNALKARLAVHRERRRVRRELMAHSDRELQEPDIARADIPRTARSKDAA